METGVITYPLAIHPCCTENSGAAIVDAALAIMTEAVNRYHGHALNQC
jgi:hypothetical protein